MIRARANISARRLTGLGAVLITPLVAAVGVALACVPSARVTVIPASGPAGMQVTMRGDGLPADTVTVDIYLDSRAPENRLKVANASSSGSDKAFSTELTMPASLGAHLLIPVPRNSVGADIGDPGSQGTGAPAAVFQVTNPTLSVAPSSGHPGSVATVTGSAFKSGTVRLRWDAPDGQELGSAAAAGAAFGFSRQITVPASAVGSHSIFAVPFGDPAGFASAPFQVTAPPPPLPGIAIPADTTGPALASAALTSGNGTRRASRKGVVSLFCGRYDEAGVTGRCSARSTGRLKDPATGRKAVLKLSAKSFQATPGRRAMVKFRLGRTGVRMLKKAKKVGMRGTVSATDAKGNPTSARFRFTLKPPR